MILRLVLGSLVARALTVGLTVLSIAVSVALFLAVEKVRTGAKDSFADTISDTDLIIGARSGAVQLLLYSVFRIGTPTNNMTWESYEEIAGHPAIDWIVPISLGDSHGQFRVMGTTNAFFERYRYRGGRPLRFEQGAAIDDLFDAVIGADVARSMGYQIGQSIIVSHGIASFSDHEDTPFRVAGILEMTGTPVDRTVIVSLEGIEAIHVDWQGGGRRPGAATPESTLRQMSLEPDAITAAFVGVSSRLELFSLQRWINTYPEEALMAVLPGVALQELWQVAGIAETALIGVSAMVIAASILGMMAVTFASLNERRREMAIWRAMGARPRSIVALLLGEAVLTATAGVAAGMVLLYAALAIVRPWIDAAFGLWLPIDWPATREMLVMLAVLGGAAAASLLPAWRAYRLSLADGMMVKT
ncbi:ABC transporter permease [Pseudoponticoccus marisrubri]|uniref:Peptide ABC transporter permease n=1 Tax=Pseudoponticoccus marisrubri TaxID=1685382 RepID=A0A0W7WDS5_9RHOB|nr:ABC transporter permease [Pseudoponticoccus marisrubri]KUF08730.1 peptide ABC transporter permease [Pseudoponticoccus marisrubri]